MVKMQFGSLRQQDIARYIHQEYFKYSLKIVFITYGADLAAGIHCVGVV